MPLCYDILSTCSISQYVYRTPPIYPEVICMRRRPLPLLSLLVATVFSCVGLSGCDPTTLIVLSNTPPATSTATTLERMGHLGVAISQDAELMKAIKNAPSAIIAVPRDSALTADSKTAAGLRRHVVLAGLTGDGPYTSVAGTTWNITGFPSQFKINGVSVLGCTPTQNSPGSSAMTSICLIDGPL